MLLTLAATSAVVLRIVLGRNRAGAGAGRAERTPSRRSAAEDVREPVAAGDR
jgi:hypothetical protein